MPSTCRHVVTSADEFDAPLWCGRGTPRVLQPGAIRADVVHLDLGDVLVETLDYSFPIASRGEVLPDRAGFVTPLRSHDATRVNGEALQPGVLHAYGPSAEVSLSSPGPLECGVLSFSEHALDRHAAQMGIDVDVPPRGEFRRIATTEWGHLRDLFHAVIGLARTRERAELEERAACALQDAFVAIAVRAFAADRPHLRLRPRVRRNCANIVRACEEYAAGAHYRSVTLAELAAASGVGERQVREAFSDCFGMSPTAYLRIAALYAARHALLVDTDTADPVTRAATEYGFWHLGRFAGQYRTLFGETPHETVIRVASGQHTARVMRAT